MHKALFVGIEAGPTHQEDTAEFLRGALEPVEHEPDTRHWYALRFGPADFAIFDTFTGNAGRLKHLFGTVGRALVVKTMSAWSWATSSSTCSASTSGLIFSRQLT